MELGELGLAAGDTPGRFDVQQGGDPVASDLFSSVEAVTLR
ncbi:MAG: hypothetical protein ACI9UK_000208 [Candidatus Krumholzibacteriia bacterium]|jgi:hypothetical protein